MKPYAHLIGGELAYLSTTTIEWTHANSMTAKVPITIAKQAPWQSTTVIMMVLKVQVLSSDKDYNSLYGVRR